MFRVAITFVCALMVSVTTLIGSAAAKNWNMSDTKSDPTNFWNKTKNAKSCNGPEFDHIRDKISIKKIKIKDTVYENLNAPLGLRSSAYCKFNYASKMVPKPLVDAKIDSKYGGKDQKRFQPIYEFLNTNIGLNRLEPAGVAASRLKKFLLSWSSADALSKNIRFTLMKKFRLDFHVQSLLPPMIIAYSDVSGSLTKNERVQVGSWLNRLVEQSQQSDFYSRQDNKVYLQHLTALLWGVVAKKGYQNAIFDMRPDGTFPKDVSRGGTGIHYQNRSTNALMALAGYATLIGENWVEYEVNGRSIEDAVKWLDKANADPSLNKVYARRCDGGSNGTIDNPNMNHLNILKTGESDISWVTLYMQLTDKKPSFLSKRVQTDRGYWSTAYGPQSCLVGE
jgi:hypothetical protein